MSNSASDGIGFVTLKDPADALVDIVFVHGLRGHMKETWTEGTTLWPQDLLPDQVPQARILTFGYDADVYRFWSPASDNSIKNHADSLTAGLIGLRHKEERTATRPIIFVAHSLGGLVCAAALVNAEKELEQPDAKSVADCTRRIAFLGTPHRGSDKAHWADSGRQFLSLFSKKTTTAVLKELEQGSATLVKLGIAFPVWLSHRAAKPETEVKIVCFFEELSSSASGVSIGKIVDEDSARLEGYPTLSIHADHISMCKFRDGQDPNYQKIVEVLERWAKELKEDTRKAPEVEIKEEDTKNTGKFVSNSTFGDDNQGNQFGMFKSKGPINFGTGGAGNIGTSHEK